MMEANHHYWRGLCQCGGARSEVGKSKKNFKGGKRHIYIKIRVAPLG
jgi:hypothetical protein